MADIKFSEFPKATTSKDSDEIAILQDGVNKMIASPVLESKIINKTVSRVIEQGGASLNVINLKGVVPTYADLALITPTPELNDAYQVEADGLVYIYTENGFQAEGDGFVVQAEPNGVVEEGDLRAVSGDEVYNAVKVVDDKLDEVVVSGINGTETFQDVLPSASSFGGSSNAYGWGFSALARKYLMELNIKLSAPTESTSQRLVIRKNNKTGEILLDKTFSLNFVGIAQLINFDFSDTPIINEDLSKLFIEIYSNTTISIYRVNPAQVFTEALGYAGTWYTTTNDMGSTGVSTGGGFSDVYHEEVVGILGVEDFTEWAKEKIAEIANENLVLPENVNTAVDLVNEHFSVELVEKGESIIFEDSLGPQGNNYYKLGFPIGVRENFNKLTVAVYYATGQVRPTTLTAILHKVNKEGDVIATSEQFSFPTSGETGRYDVVFQFNDYVTESGRIYLEIVGNGQFGAYRRAPNPTSIFTSENGYPPLSFTTSVSGSLVDSAYYFDFWFKTNIVEEVTKLQGVEIELPNANNNFSSLPDANESDAIVGDSVVWGDGYLQSGFVAEYIKFKQSSIATTVLASEFTNGTILNNRKYYLGKALRLDGAGQEIEFTLKGNEVSIIQSIERSNVNASEIEVYIDNVLYDTFNNFNNAPLGTETKSFTGDGTAVMFDLGRAFTYGHIVNVDGDNKIVTQNISQGTGFTIPAGSDCAIIRRLGQDANGKTIVSHWLWFKTAPASSANINIDYSYGENLFYEKTTIGENANGVTECPYGDGDVSFDPTAPSGISSGLDFRKTDERVVKTYRFTEEKERVVKLKVKGNYNGSSGTPYFIFNFATNRYFKFMNAGIGGWDLWDLDVTINEDYLRCWQRVVEFNPNKIILSTSNNDDWIVKGHKVYNTKTVGLTELRSIKNLPLRSIVYNSGSDNYEFSKWRGAITAITETTITFSGTIDTPINEGDVIMIGQYWGNNFDYKERIVSSVDGNTLGFNKPISNEDIIYNDLSDFIGKEIGVRDLSSFKNKLSGLIDKIRVVTDCDIYVLENPMPNVLARELWGYPIIMKSIASEKNKVYTIDYSSLIKWQQSTPKTTVSVNISASTTDTYLDKQVIEFGNAGQNILAVDVLLNGESIYGKRAVVENGWAYVVNQTLTGASLNKGVANQVNSGQTTQGRKPRVVILDDTLTTGTLEVKYATNLWSNDSCHMNTIAGALLYRNFLTETF